MFTPGPSAVPRCSSTQKLHLCSLHLSWAGLVWFWEHVQSWGVCAVGAENKLPCFCEKGTAVWALPKHIGAYSWCWTFLSFFLGLRGRIESLLICQHLWFLPFNVCDTKSAWSILKPQWSTAAKFKLVDITCSVSREIGTCLPMQFSCKPGAETVLSEITSVLPWIIQTLGLFLELLE